MNEPLKNIGYFTLFILGVLFSCTKNDANKKQPSIPIIGDSLQYTINISGDHMWSGIVIDYNPDTTYNISYDRSIIVINDSTIFFYASAPYSVDTLHYNTYNKTDSTLTFTSKFEALPVEYENDTMIYNYSNNSIIYKSSGDDNGHGGTETVHSP